VQLLCNSCFALNTQKVITLTNSFPTSLFDATSKKSAFFGQVDYFWIAFDPRVFWKIHYETQTDFSILVDCARGSRVCRNSLSIARWMLTIRTLSKFL
jgi:hypothetical protein